LAMLNRLIEHLELFGASAHSHTTDHPGMPSRSVE
jgi:hypothetical protein